MSEYTPAGELSPVEKAWQERILEHGVLGWTYKGRNRDGYLVATATLPGGVQTRTVKKRIVRERVMRDLVATLTPAGLTYSETRRLVTVDQESTP